MRGQKTVIFNISKLAPLDEFRTSRDDTYEPIATPSLQLTGALDYLLFPINTSFLSFSTPPIKKTKICFCLTIWLGICWFVLFKVAYTIKMSF